MASAFYDCALYHQTKIPIGFWYRRGLNARSLIQLSETLPVALIKYTLIIYRGICQTPLYFLNDLYLHSRFHLTFFFFFKCIGNYIVCAWDRDGASTL